MQPISVSVGFFVVRLLIVCTSVRNIDLILLCCAGLEEWMRAENRSCLIEHRKRRKGMNGEGETKEKRADAVIT